MNIYFKNLMKCSVLYRTKTNLFSHSLILLGFASALLFAPATLQAQCPNDFDCDGIINVEDLDDDNDGITDINENECLGLSQPIPADAVNNSIDRVALHDGSNTPQMIRND